MGGSRKGDSEPRAVPGPFCTPCVQVHTLEFGPGWRSWADHRDGGHHLGGCEIESMVCFLKAGTSDMSSPIVLPFLLL